MSKPFAWSYSRLTSFEDCPWRFYLTQVAKRVVEKPSPEMDWGKRVHKGLELRVAQDIPLPETLQQYEPIAASVQARCRAADHFACEEKVTLNRDYRPTSWFGADAYIRVINDVRLTRGTTAAVFDYKTGKPQHASFQLKLAAAALLQADPALDKVITGFIWLQTGQVEPETYTREDAPDIWQAFAPRVTRFEKAWESETYPKRPSGLCRGFCPAGKTNCEHWEPKR